jgi:hypothetical protein
MIVNGSCCIEQWLRFALSFSAATRSSGAFLIDRFPGIPASCVLKQFKIRISCGRSLPSRERARAATTDRSLDQIGDFAMALARRSIGGIDEDIRVKADQRSCISSRLKRLPPIGSPFRISATMCLIASSRSRGSATR